MVEHHLDPVASLKRYNDHRQAILPHHPTLDLENYRVMDDPVLVANIARYNELAPFAYSGRQVDLIIEFLHALTDPGSLDMRDNIDVVEGVPSGLPVDD